MSHTSAHADQHGTNGSAPASLGSVTIEIGGVEVTLPVKFSPGHALTENQARVLDAAYQRQFTNNMNANQTNRAKAEKPALTAAEIAAAYTDYEPNVGGTPRQSTMEKLRHEAAWRFWSARVAAHNESVASGGEPVIVKAGKKAVTLGFRSVKDEAGKVVSSAQDQKDSFCGRLLAAPDYAGEIQEYLDAIMAERGSKTAPAAEATVGSADLI